MKKNINILTTTRCNLQCKHCLREHGGLKENKDLPLNLLKKALREGQTLGYNHVCFTGGEPYLHPRFDALVALVVEKGYNWSIITNGWLAQRYEPSLRRYGENCTLVSVSLDGLEDTHDAVRAPGSFVRALQALEFFKGLGMKISVLVNLNALNYHQLPDMLELAVLKQVEQITIGSVIPNDSNRYLLITEGQKEAAYTFLKEAEETLPTRLRLCTSLHSVEDPEKFCGNLDYPGATINAYGEYIFCCDTIGRGAVVGNLRTQSLTDLYIYQIKLGARLKELRRKRIKKGQLFAGFNSCNFCNTMLELLPEGRKIK